MNNLSIRGLVFSALFAAVLIALSFLKFPLPFSPVPVTMQTLAVMLAATILGARYGTISVIIVIGLVAAGFPVLGGRGGLSILVGPTAGFIISWPLATLVLGYLAKRLKQTKFTGLKLFFLNFLFGSILLYPLGVGWLAYSTHMTTLTAALSAGMIPFLPGDLVKAAISAVVTVSVWKVYPMEAIHGDELRMTERLKTKKPA